VAVLVADLDAEAGGVRPLLHALKVAYPQILTVAVTGAGDALMLIDLINEVQVYRFLGRPLNPAQLKEHVAAALNRYHTYKTTPALLSGQKVEPGRRGEGTVLQPLLQRLKNLRLKLPFGAG
jgi:DNA-binding NtrC family response regulator